MYPAHTEFIEHHTHTWIIVHCISIFNIIYIIWQYTTFSRGSLWVNRKIKVIIFQNISLTLCYICRGLISLHVDRALWEIKAITTIICITLFSFTICHSHLGILWCVLCCSTEQLPVTTVLQLFWVSVFHCVTNKTEKFNIVPQSD